MDLDEFRYFVLDSGVDVWTWINMAISMASADYENELKIRRDGIVQKLYATSSVSKCRNCDYQIVVDAECKGNGNDLQNRDMGYDDYRANRTLKSQNLPNADEEEEEQDDDDDYNEEDAQRKILDIRNLLDDQNQDEIGLIGHLRRLVDMEITFKVLKETDIGRYVTRLRKHSSNEVRSLVKILVRKWKEIVDEWVSKNPPVEEMAHFNGDKYMQKNNGEIVTEMTPSRDARDAHTSSCSTPSKRKMKIKRTEQDNSKLFHGNYKDFPRYGNEPLYENKKQRTSQADHILKTKHPIFPGKEGSVAVKHW